MKKRGIGFILLASAMAAMLPGAAQAAKNDSCPAGTWGIVSGAFLLGVDRVGDRTLDPGAFYCAKLNPGQSSSEPFVDVWVVGPEIEFTDV